MENRKWNPPRGALNGPAAPRPGVNVAQGGAGWTNLLFDQGSANLSRVNETHRQVTNDTEQSGSRTQSLQKIRPSVS